MNVSEKNKYISIAEIKKKYLDEYIKIIKHNTNFTKIRWGQKLYNYIHNLSSPPKCICGNDLTFLKFSKGYNKYCSSKCRYSDENLKNKIKESYIKKYGVKNPLQSKEILQKRKENFLKKYGVEHQSQLNEVKEKKKQTNLIKYGEEYIFKTINFKEKSKQTNLIKYGVEHTSLSKEIRKKQLITKRKNKIKKYTKLLNIGDSNINYINNILIIKKYCNKHQEFEISTNLFHQRWFKYDKKICTKCFPIQKQISGSEKEIKYFIENLLSNNINNNNKILNRKEIDIYLPEHKLGIEFDGLYWHSDFFKDKNYHLNKTELCEKEGIQLLHIFEDEWIYKKDIVKSIIKSKINIIDNKIFARKCEIKEINNNNLIHKFLNDNHLQGFVGSKIKIGLFYNDELVSLMTFGKKRLAMGNKQYIDGEYEMLRFCNKLNTQVIGGASKLLKYFIKNYQPKSILTFADRRYSNGNLYKQLGFKFIGNTKPNYWYFKNNDLVRYHRFNFRKNNNLKSLVNYYCIYDCGHMKFELNK